MKAPCKDCGKRHVGCHDACEEYKTFAEEQRSRLKFCAAKQTDVYIAQRRRAKK